MKKRLFAVGLASRSAGGGFSKRLLQSRVYHETVALESKP